MDKVWLRALEPDDYKYTHKWRTDDATWSAVAGTKRFVSLDTERRWLIDAIENHEKGVVLRLVVCLGDTDEPVGLISATSIDHINKSCELGSMLSLECRGKGVIQRAWIQVSDYLFNELGMNRVECFIISDNQASRRSHEKFGNVQEGVLRKAIYKNGEFKDFVCYSLLRDEFFDIHSEGMRKLSS